MVWQASRTNSDYILTQDVNRNDATTAVEANNLMEENRRSLLLSSAQSKILKNFGEQWIFKIRWLTRSLTLRPREHEHVSLRTRPKSRSSTASLRPR